MSTSKLSDLFKKDEKKYIDTLKANVDIDKSRAMCIDTLQKKLDECLLIYNSECSGETVRQVSAESMISLMKSDIGMLNAFRVKKEEISGKTSGKAIIAAVAAGVFLLASLIVIFISGIVMMSSGVNVQIAADPETVILQQGTLDKTISDISLGITLEIVAGVLMLPAVALAFAAGRMWLKEKEIVVHPSLDIDVLKSVLDTSMKTADAKTDGVLEAVKAEIQRNSHVIKNTDASGMDSDTVTLYADMLEAAYSHNSELALKRIESLEPYLKQKGFELVDYSEENAELFRIFPSKRQTGTVCPAVTFGGKTVIEGKAVVAEGKK